MTKVMRLTRDVVNPYPDRRRRSTWNCREVWKAGMKFVVREFDVGERYDIPDLKGVRVKEVRPTDCLGDWMLQHPRYPERESTIIATTILEALEDIPRTVRTILQAADIGSNSTEWILERLLTAGKLTLDDVESAVKDYMEADE